jgi:hypothetical protein
VTAQRLSRIAAGIAIVTVLGVTALVTRNVLWPDDPDASLQRNGGKVMGDIAGYVGRVDREARTVDISSSLLGIRPVVLVVTNETAIVVNGKQGAIGDLWKDLPVKVSYEVRDNARYATSIQVTAGDSRAPLPGTKTKDEATAAPASLPVADPPAAAASTKETKAPSVATSPAPVTSPAPPMVPVSVATKPTPVAQPPAAVAQHPAPRVEEPAVARVPARAATSASSAESASVGSSRAARPAPAEPDADGSAAIDWLLKDAGRR